MISITLTPQSEAHVDAIAEAMRALLRTVQPPAAARAEPAAMAQAVAHAEQIHQAKEVEQPKAPKAPKPVKATAEPTPSVEPAAIPVASATATTQPDPAAKAEPATESPSEATVSTTIEYAQVGKAITDMVKNNRDHAVATLAKFGAKKGTELKPADYAAFLKELG